MTSEIRSGENGSHGLATANGVSCQPICSIKDVVAKWWRKSWLKRRTGSSKNGAGKRMRFNMGGGGGNQLK